MKNLLILNKKTIAKLNEDQLTAIEGGNNSIVVNCNTDASVVILSTKR